MKEIKTILANNNDEINLKKKRVAAYARVSTTKDSQESSIDLQVYTYAKEILANPEYEFAGVYADHGKSGSSRDERDQFNFMIEKALIGEIDLILTKSLSRFARNTLDSLTIIKQLREKNIEIYFEKENISSLDTSIDFIISVLSGMAEAESKQVSDNCYWTINKRYQDGSLDITHLFGYDITEDRELTINPYQAKAVRQIFKMYLDYKTIPEIIKWLEINNYKTIRGNSKWSRSTIKGMLRQEKYVGDAILQKRCRKKIGSKSSIINNGLKTKFKINNNHHGIISRDIFEKTQRIMDERNAKFNKDKEPINKSYYYKYVYSLVIHKYLQKKTNYKNDISNEVLVDYDSNNTELKPIAIKCIDQAIDDAINKLTTDLNSTFNRLEVITNNIIFSNKIDEEIKQTNEEIDYLKERIDSLNQLNITEELKSQFYSETNSELITKEFALIELKNKKLLEYDFKHNLVKFKKLLKENKDSTDIDKRTLISKIIAMDRDNLILCIHLSNKKLKDLNLEDYIDGEIVESGNFAYKQSRIESIVNWKVIII